MDSEVRNSSRRAAELTMRRRRRRSRDARFCTGRSPQRHRDNYRKRAELLGMIRLLISSVSLCLCGLPDHFFEL